MLHVVILSLPISMLHVVILFPPTSISHTLLSLCALVSSLEVFSVSVRQMLLSLCPSELRNCVKVEAAVLGSPSLIILMVSADVKQQWTWTFTLQSLFSKFPQCRYKAHVVNPLHPNLFSGGFFSGPPKGGWGCLMSTSCLESQGCWEQKRTQQKRYRISITMVMNDDQNHTRTHARTHARTHTNWRSLESAGRSSFSFVRQLLRVCWHSQSVCGMAVPVFMTKNYLMALSGLHQNSGVVNCHHWSPSSPHVSSAK